MFSRKNSPFKLLSQGPLAEWEDQRFYQVQKQGFFGANSLVKQDDPRFEPSLLFSFALGKPEMSY